MNPFDAWLDARDGNALAAAWNALSPTTIELGPEPTHEIGILGFYRTGAAAAQLANAWLGIPLDKLKWLTVPSDYIDDHGAPPSSYKASRVVDRSFLEHRVDVTEECYERWDLREVRAGKRGLQWLHVAWGIDDGTREGANSRGGFGFVVRVYDRERRAAVCVALHTRTISTIGEIGVDVRAPLDLFDFNPNFRMPAWTTFDPDKARGLIAQLATEVDAHYDQSAGWAGKELRRSESPGLLFTEMRYENGPHAITMEERRTGDGGEIDLRLDGLPWGQQLRGSIRFTPEGAWAHFNARLPEACATGMLGRMRTLDGVVLG